MISIRRRLFVWLMGALSVGAIAITSGSYTLTLEEMNEVFDEELKQVALTALTHAHEPRAAPKPPIAGSDLVDVAFVTQVWSLDGHLLFSSRPQAGIAFDDKEGIRTVTLADGPWRVYTDQSASYFTQAAQPVAVRHRLAAEVALKTLIPTLAAVPVLVLLVLVALQRGLRSLTHTAQDVGTRSAVSLEPIDAAGLPAELHPLVVSINGLMEKLSRALASQRHFTADAAHELRTPLTALGLQLQLLLSAQDDAARAEALADIQKGLARANRLVEQLLQMSRLEPDAPFAPATPVRLDELAKTVVADFSARAALANVDLGVVVDDAPQPLVAGDAEELRVMLNNLVDNALRHAPEGSRVDVAVRAHGSARDEIAVEVSDAGPGIAPEDRERVFDRFYRKASEAHPGGTGLGLAIVKAVVQRHRARLELAPGQSRSDGGRGLLVRIVFPAGPRLSAV
ncbi:MAG TPA: ATP-binding protein [Albitalea sp.]|nr:ATP-binding protein [Albitalea sp.]